MITRYFIWLSLFMMPRALLAQQTSSANRLNWQGYVQVRGATDLDTLHEFSLNRLKFWLSGRHQLGKGQLLWHTKVLFSSHVGRNPLLLDAYLGYKTGRWQLLVGQQIPDFSLQRAQPDYLIAENLRTRTVATLVPASFSAARDIGLQVKYWLPDKRGHIAAGIFNGTGANRFSLSADHYLFTGRVVYRILDQAWHLDAGASYMQRSFTDQRFIPITLTGEQLSGFDRRYGVEVAAGNDRWQWQGEYIMARLAGRLTRGGYVQGQCLLGKRHMLFASVEDYRNDWQQADTQYYTLGYSYRMAGDIAKITVDYRLANDLTNKQTSNLLIVQWQYMFNKTSKPKYHD